MASINVNNLPAKAAAAITTADQVMTFTASGDTTQTPFSEAVAQAQVLNDCYCIMQKTVSVSSAQILTLLASPIAFGIVPDVGFYIKPLGCDVYYTPNTLAYAGASVLCVTTTDFANRIMEADGSIFGFVTYSAVQMTNRLGAVGDVQLLDGSDVYLTTDIAPTLGNGSLKVVLTYLVLPTP